MAGCIEFLSSRKLAIGRLPQGYVQNEVSTRAYSEAIAGGRLATVKRYALKNDDRLRAEIIERIMCDFGADFGQICARHGSAADAILGSSTRLWNLISDGIVKLDGTTVDAHLHGSQQRHSRAV